MLLYRLTNEDDARRLEELAGTDDPTDLSSDLALARLLQEKAVNAGQIGTAVALQNTIAKLATAAEGAKVRRGELLAKDAVLTLASSVVEILARNITGRFPGWEETVDSVREEILTITCAATNVEENKNNV